MELLTQYADRSIYGEAARIWSKHFEDDHDYYIPNEEGGTKICNAIVEIAIHEVFPEWTVEDAIEKMTPELFFDLGLNSLLRGNDKRQKLYCPPFLLVTGATAFPNDPVRSQARFAPINVRYVMQWVFGQDPDWKEVVAYYYHYLNGKRRTSAKPGTVRCNQFLFESWWFEKDGREIHSPQENAFIAMELFLADLEREGVLNPGAPSDGDEYLRKIYHFFAQSGNDQLISHGLGSYEKPFHGPNGKGDPVSYIHQYLTSIGIGNYAIAEQERFVVKMEKFNKRQERAQKVIAAS